MSEPGTYEESVSHCSGNGAELLTVSNTESAMEALSNAPNIGTITNNYYNRI